MINYLKRSYSKPSLVEYGHLSELTLGALGTKPDYKLNGTKFVLVNIDCNAAPPATACLLPS